MDKTICTMLYSTAKSAIQMLVQLNRTRNTKSRAGFREAEWTAAEGPPQLILTILLLLFEMLFPCFVRIRIY